MTTIADQADVVRKTGVDLLWIPLGAGGHVVRLNGKVIEAITALLQRRRRLDLYHAALEVSVDDRRYVIELASVPDGDGQARGVVGDGPVGTSPSIEGLPNARRKSGRKLIVRRMSGTGRPVDSRICS
jgi:hypothetical protein